MKYEWAIIGGGVHGCTIANYLIKSGRTTTKDLVILDPHDEPMKRWKALTSRIDMKYLRSPFVHHIDVKAFSLQQFHDPSNHTDFYGPYKRPSLSLFNEHCSSIIQEIDLTKCWIKGRVIEVCKEAIGWEILTSSNRTVLAENIVICISANESVHIPKWAEGIRAEGLCRISHIFSEDLKSLEDLHPPIVVVGGGITAAHTVIKLSKIFPGDVTLLSRHELRVHGFDSDPGWLGQKNMQSFSKEKDYDMRRKYITTARHRGSMPKEIYQKLKNLERNGLLRIVLDEVLTISKKETDFGLKLKSDTEEMVTKSILFATGFSFSVQETSWLKKLILSEKLRCANCGYPIVNQKLEWCPHLYVSGPLAELEIGPVSRNISGARKAAERIVNHHIL